MLYHRQLDEEVSLSVGGKEWLCDGITDNFLRNKGEIFSRKWDKRIIFTVNNEDTIISGSGYVKWIPTSKKWPKNMWEVKIPHYIYMKLLLQILTRSARIQYWQYYCYCRGVKLYFLFFVFPCCVKLQKMISKWLRLIKYTTNHELVFWIELSACKTQKGERLDLQY